MKKEAYLISEKRTIVESYFPNNGNEIKYQKKRKYLFASRILA